jgi:hypothetical protein
MDMKKILLLLLPLAGACSNAGAQALAALGNGNQLYTTNDPANPAPVTTPHLVRGIAPGYTLVAIEYQPGTGQLYGIAHNRVDATAQLYLIQPDAATAMPVGTNLRGAAWNEGSRPGLDFSPDGQLYLTNADGSHYVLPVEGGADLTIARVASRRRAPQQILSASYATSSAAGVSGSARYGYDPAHHALASYNMSRQVTGTIALPGTPFSTGGSVAMDLDYRDGAPMAYVAGPSKGGTALYSVDLASGEAVMIGSLGGKSLRIRDISISLDAGNKVTGAKGYSPSGGPQRTEVFSMYPNPARGFTNVLLTDIPQDKVYVHVVNLNGQIMQSRTFDPGANNLHLDMSTLPAGLYSIQVQERGKAVQALKVQVENQ